MYNPWNDSANRAAAAEANRQVDNTPSVFRNLSAVPGQGDFPFVSRTADGRFAIAWKAPGFRIGKYTFATLPASLVSRLKGQRFAWSNRAMRVVQDQFGRNDSRVITEDFTGYVFPENPYSAIMGAAANGTLPTINTDKSSRVGKDELLGFALVVAAPLAVAGAQAAGLIGGAAKTGSVAAASGSTGAAGSITTAPGLAAATGQTGAQVSAVAAAGTSNAVPVGLASATGAKGGIGLTVQNALTGIAKGTNSAVVSTVKTAGAISQVTKAGGLIASLAGAGASPGELAEAELAYLQPEPMIEPQGQSMMPLILAGGALLLVLLVKGA